MILLNLKQHRSKLNVILLLPLLVMLIGCSTVSTQTKKVYPDESWVVDTELGITKDMLSDYGNVRSVALPQAIKAVDSCNADKATIRTWMIED